MEIYRCVFVAATMKKLQFTEVYGCVMFASVNDELMEPLCLSTFRGRSYRFYSISTGYLYCMIINYGSTHVDTSASRF